MRRGGRGTEGHVLRGRCGQRCGGRDRVRKGKNSLRYVMYISISTNENDWRPCVLLAIHSSQPAYAYCNITPSLDSTPLHISYALLIRGNSIPPPLRLRTRARGGCWFKWAQERRLERVSRTTRIYAEVRTTSDQHVSFFLSFLAEIYSIITLYTYYSHPHRPSSHLWSHPSLSYVTLILFFSSVLSFRSRRIFSHI